MENPTLFSCHEYRFDKQELVRAAWKRHFQVFSKDGHGLIASTFVVDANQAGCANVSFVFMDRESMLAFETSIAYGQYIWDVLPLLDHKPTLRSLVAENIPAAMESARRDSRNPAVSKRKSGKSHHVLTSFFEFMKREHHDKTAS